MQKDYITELLDIFFPNYTVFSEVKSSVNSTQSTPLCRSILEVITSVIVKPGGIWPSWSGSVCDGLPSIRRVMVWGTVSEDSHHPPVWYDWQEPLTRHVLLVLYYWVYLFLSPSKGFWCDINETRAKTLKDCLNPFFYLGTHDLSCHRNPLVVNVTHDLSQPFFITASVVLLFSSPSVAVGGVALRTSCHFSTFALTGCASEGGLSHNYLLNTRMHAFTQTHKKVF